MEIEDKLRKILPPYMVPKLFYCSSFPTLVNGKIDRQALIKSYEENLVFEATYTDEELKFDGCTDPSLYENARVVLNSICSTLGILPLNFLNFNSLVRHYKSSFLIYISI